MVHIVPEAAGTEKTERRYQIPMWGYFIALISGALMSIQGVFNSGVTKQTSVWLAASFVQFSAMLVCLAAWFLNGHPGTVLDLFRIDRKYMLLGGVIGAFITYTCCSGDLADLKVKSIDVEAWSPRQQKYFEVGSCSNLGDAQARRLGIRIKGEGKNYFAHTLNNTVVAPPRMLIAFLENNLNDDGSVRIPEPLRMYMGGKDVIRP